MFYCYSNNGLSYRAVDDDYQAQAGELNVPSNVTGDALTETLAAFFPAYTNSVENTVAINEATLMLSSADVTMNRIAEAVSLGQSAWTAPDVVAWVEYRRALRLIITNKGGTLPIKPAYPAGT